MKLDELIELINLHKADREISIEVQNRETQDYFKVVDEFPKEKIICNLNTNQIINIFNSVFKDAKIMYSKGMLYDYRLESEFSDSDESNSYRFNVMKNTSYGGSGIFELRIFFTNKKSMEDKISKLKTPYQKLAYKYIKDVHPYLYTFRNVIDSINGNFYDFFCNVYNQYGDDIKWQYINMNDFKNIILDEMKGRILFNDILEDFIMCVDENKKRLVIKNNYTKFAIKVSQWTETNYCRDISDVSDEM